MPGKEKEAAPPLPAALWQMDEVMAFLQLSRAQVNRLIAHEGLPHLKLGGALRFHPHHIAVWLEQQQKAG